LSAESIRKIDYAISLIPDRAPLWCPPGFGAHMALREKMKSLPVNFGYTAFFENDRFDPEYILAYEPFDNEQLYLKQYREGLKDVLSRHASSVIFREGGLVILKLEER
jgi:hypothetical protein